MLKQRIALVIRILVAIAASALILLFVTQLLIGVGRNIGTLTGLILCITALIYCLATSKINKRIAATWGKRSHGRRILIGVIIAASLIFLTATMETVFLIRYTHRQAPASEDGKPPVLIVLGCQVKDGRPSLLLQNRIDTAYDYLTAHPECFCIVSGGQGSDEAMSEAKCMYDELTKMGIDSERIYVEDQSTSTRENLEFSKAIMERENLGDTAILVTNSFHELRAQLAAESIGIPCGGESADTPWWLMPSFYLRELWGILYELVF